MVTMDDILIRATMVLAAANERKVVWATDNGDLRECIMRNVNWDRGEVRITSTDTGIELWFGTGEIMDMLRVSLMAIVGRDGRSAHIGLMD